MKSGELEKRGERRAEALAAIEKAKEEGNMEEVDKQSRRIVKVGLVFLLVVKSS
jgi:flap endonuclease-1